MFIIEHPIIMWSFLIIAFCILLALHILENKKIKANLRKEYTDEVVKKITRFNWFRSTQLFLIMGFFFILIALYESRVRDVSEQLETLQDVISINAKIDSEQQDEQNLENRKNYYPPIISNDDIDEENSSESSTKNTIQDIFGVKKNSSNSKNTIDSIKTRYEELLVTYFLMEKCQKTSDSDYKLIISALQKEITALQAPARLQDDTLVAAKGSYEELYSQNDCLKSDLQATEAQYNAYISSLLANAKGN